MRIPGAAVVALHVRYPAYQVMRTRPGWEESNGNARQRYLYQRRAIALIILILLLIWIF
jgi:hypothetical protein